MKKKKNLTNEEKLKKFTHEQLGMLFLLSRKTPDDMGGMSMKDAQAYLDITDDEFQALLQTLYDVGALKIVPAKDGDYNNCIVDFDLIE